MLSRDRPGWFCPLRKDVVVTRTFSRMLRLCAVIGIVGLACECQAQPTPIVPADNLPRAQNQSKFAVLSIGISRYDHVQHLQFTTHDAHHIAGAYREVGQLRPDRITLLVDQPPEQEPITTSRLTQRLEQFLSSAASAETVVIFFSGHGYAVDDNFYLVTSDFDPDKLEDTAFALDRLRNQLIECPAATKIVILDCCYSGAFGEAHRIRGERLASSFRIIPGCVAMTASSGLQESFEKQELGAGVFTYWLTRGLRGQANTNADQWVDMIELFDFVSSNVKAATDSRQTPAFSVDQSTAVPKVMPLVKPDRPSDLVGIIPFPLPPTPQTMEVVLDSIGRFPAANPRRTIGACNWVIKHADPNSKAAKMAHQLRDKIDQLILTGKARLGPIEEDEQPR